MSKTIIKKINNIEEIEIVKKIEDYSKKEVTPIKIHDFLEFDVTRGACGGTYTGVLLLIITWGGIYPWKGGRSICWAWFAG